MRKAVILLAASLAVLSSCQRLNIVGKPVVFTASSRNEITKTVYSGNNTGTHEEIYWVDGDQVLIQSSDKNVASIPGSDVTSVVYDLTVNPDRSFATISNTEATPNGLVWNETSPVTFYGAYPGNITPRSTTGQFDMTVVKDQVYADLTDPSKTLDMSKAYMLAKTDVAAGASTVKLDFYPAFTAFEIHLANRTAPGAGSGDITLKSLSIKSTSDDLAGSYYNTWSGGTASFTASGAGEKEVKVTFPANTTISDTKEVAFTLFVMPVKNVTNLCLEVTFETSSGTTKTKKLDLKQNGSFIEFAACKKHRLTGVTLDSGETWELYMTLDIVPQPLDREDNSLVDSNVENKLTELTVTNYEDADFTTGEIVLNHNRGIFYFFTEVGRWTRWQASLIGTPGVFAFCKEDGTYYLDVNGTPRTTFSGSIDGNTQYFYIKAIENSPTGRALLRITAFDNRGNSKVVYDMVNFNDFSEYTLIKNTR